MRPTNWIEALLLGSMNKRAELDVPQPGLPCSIINDFARIRKNNFEFDSSEGCFCP